MPFNPANWNEQSNRFGDTVVIGNGASIAIDGRLAYPSLYNAAIDNGHLDAQEQQIFEFFGTQDFEFVLRALSHANSINQHLQIEETSTGDAYQSIKASLIETVRGIHPEYADVRDSLARATQFLGHFRSVFSLNYDLFIYWAMMVGNEIANCNRFKDCFVNGSFRTDYQDFRIPIDACDTTTLVFYPHGNLVLVTDMWGNESKLKQNEQDLVRVITESWQIGGDTPLFVSEGGWKRKQSAIGRNYYLQTVVNELAAPKTSVFAYGWNFGEQDRHLVRAIKKSGATLLGISVYTGEGSDPDHFCYETSRQITQQIGGIEVLYFDAADDGLWIHQDAPSEA